MPECLDRMNNGALEKVRICAYTDNTFAGEPVKIFHLPLNPENYSKNLKVETDNRRGHGNQGTDPRYKGTVPEELKIDFIIDGTGAVENYRYTDPDKVCAKDQLQLFLDVVYRINGQIHRPNFLKVHWGKHLTFSCILSNLEINYQLFEPAGEPLRIKLSTTFLNYLSPKERVERERLGSPDLTHMRQTKAGDRLDLMTHNIYKDTKYLLQVAQANGLTSFRRLDSGVDLHFPPIDKAET